MFLRSTRMNIQLCDVEYGICSTSEINSIYIVKSNELLFMSFYSVKKISLWNFHNVKMTDWNDITFIQ